MQKGEKQNEVGSGVVEVKFYQHTLCKCIELSKSENIT